MTDFISQVKTLAEAWPAKLMATAAGVILSEVFQLHLHLILLFALLEFVDCFSKWLAQVTQQAQTKSLRQKQRTLFPGVMWFGLLAI